MSRQSRSRLRDNVLKRLPKWLAHKQEMFSPFHNYYIEFHENMAASSSHFGYGLDKEKNGYVARDQLLYAL